MKTFWIVRAGTGLLLLLSSAVGIVQAAAPAPAIELKRDDQRGQLQILIDSREAIAYQYAADLDFPHYYPVRSPSGKPLTVQYPDDRHSHHRSIWVNDIVQPPNHEPISFYGIGVTEESKRTARGFRDCIRHMKFLGEDVVGGQAVIRTQATWLADFGQLRVLDEVRRLRVVPLGRGEYMLDLQFELQANYDDVSFVSEWNHYAWPYVRMHAKFVKEAGGAITNSAGGVNEQGTHEKRAFWVDCSNCVDGVTEGLAVFPVADGETPPLWLVRDYGTFGPRRPDARSGVPFVLKKGESLKQHVGILVHSGDAATGRVAERYQEFMAGLGKS
ncbi:MAG: hypothetical protein GX575_05085 [Candidatus Anammoximicrobium sp.]|nr:hypothetical protein [Candidatus Anammoximicrobium sp.]